MQAHYVWRRKVDWQQLRSAAFSRARGARKPSDTYAAIESAIQSLHNRHSSFRDPKAFHDG